MNTYKLYKYNGAIAGACYQTSLGTCMFGFTDPNNKDYQTFKKEVLAGAELQDADGNVMTQEQADDFIKELP
jgi:hypothetical protein